MAFKSSGASPAKIWHRRSVLTIAADLSSANALTISVWKNMSRFGAKSKPLNQHGTTPRPLMPSRWVKRVTDIRSNNYTGS
jgi:hypothetical protein